jgi:hypothetical protein
VTNIQNVKFVRTYIQQPSSLFCRVNPQNKAPCTIEIEPEQFSQYSEGFGLDGRGLIHGKRFFYSLQFRTCFGTHTASYSMGTGVKQPGREVDHSLPSSAEIKNGGAMLPLPHASSWRGA